MLIAEAKLHKQSPITSVIEQENGTLHFIGKIVDVQRSVESGFNKGVVKIQGLETFSQQTSHIFNIT